MSNVSKIVTSPKTKGIVSLAAAVVMYFTPDNVDRIIETLLAGFGIGSFFGGDGK
jgi:O-methyltransferase involved in polyketide biosynthesis